VSPRSEIISYYDQNADTLARRYESLTFELVHRTLPTHLPTPPGWAIDIGAGSGRDAATLSRRGFSVVAVEPSARMREIGAHLHAREKITWIDDTLPELQSVNRSLKFKVVLSSAVWMHLDRQQQEHAMRTIFDLTAPGGRAFITFRSRSPHDEATIFPITVDDVVTDADRTGYISLNYSSSKDRLGRSGVVWHSLAFEKPESPREKSA
jgi:2-polyprenyl-3-methyl-5-hydroxy-6-metoxy-1,4-benzoquinol methylase